MKKVAIIIFISVLLFSCTEPTSIDENINAEVFQENNYFPLEVGNEWVFNTYFTNGTEQISPVYQEKMIVERKLEVDGVDAFEISIYFENEKYLTTYITSTDDQIWLYGKTIEPILFRKNEIKRYTDAFSFDETSISSTDSCCYLNEKWSKIFDYSEINWRDSSVTEGDTFSALKSDGQENEIIKIKVNHIRNVFFEKSSNNLGDFAENSAVYADSVSQWINFTGYISSVIDGEDDSNDVKFQNGSDTYISQTFSADIQFVEGIGMGYSRSKQIFNDLDNESITVICERVLVSSKIIK